MRSSAVRAAAVLSLTLLCGCPSLAGPNWFHPGSAEAQRRRALQFDPYLQNESGDAVVGVRPREYDKPPPEPSRSRWVLGDWKSTR